MTDYVQTAEQLGGANAVLLAKMAGDLLNRHYPGWLWAIQIDEDGGVLSILNLRLSGEWGYRFRLSEISGDAKVAVHQFKMAAGEILERFRVPRGTYRYEDWLDAPKFAGMAMPDIGDKTTRTQRVERDGRLSRALQFGTAKLRVTDQPGRRDVEIRL